MAYTVTTYESAQQLSDAISLPVVPNLDDAQLQNQAETGDTVISGGALFTLIVGALPVGIQVLAKGLYYTVLEETI